MAVREQRYHDILFSFLSNQTANLILFLPQVERLYRDVRAYAIPGGSEEIMLDLSIRQSMRVHKALGMKL